MSGHNCGKGENCCEGVNCIGEYEKINKKIESYKNNGEKVRHFAIKSIGITNNTIFHEYGQGIGGICRDYFRKEIGRRIRRNILDIEKMGKNLDLGIEKIVVEKNIELYKNGADKKN